MRRHRLELGTAVVFGPWMKSKRVLAPTGSAVQRIETTCKMSARWAGFEVRFTRQTMRQAPYLRDFAETMQCLRDQHSAGVHWG